MEWLLPAVVGALVALVVANLLASHAQVTPPSWAECALTELEAKGAGLRGELDILSDQWRRVGGVCRQSVPTGRAPQSSGSGLVIPPDAKANGQVDFMEGCWSNHTSLTSTRTNSAVVVDYCFDANGTGTRTIQEAEGATCSGQAKAGVTADGTLSINDVGRAACSDGHGYVPTSIRCHRGADGRADCNIVQAGLADVETSFLRR